jgi:hypothetical protein
MADERQSGEGRRQDAAKPQASPERYPAVNQCDAVESAMVAGEPRSFDPSADAPTPRYRSEALPASVNEGRLGPQGDPAEGKR